MDILGCPRPFKLGNFLDKKIHFTAFLKRLKSKAGFQVGAMKKVVFPVFALNKAKATLKDFFLHHAPQVFSELDLGTELAGFGILVIPSKKVMLGFLLVLRKRGAARIAEEFLCFARMKSGPDSAIANVGWGLAVELMAFVFELEAVE